jgi:precorrin-2 dehydrogenase/sirohydrochlorin ferrochelatase
MLDVTDRKIIIIGGGQVALRKAHGLLAAGATDITCIAPQQRDEMPPTVKQIVARFEPKHLDGAGLVFAATDSADVNEQVVAAAHERGIWVNRADVNDQEPGDFTLPAVLRQGALSVAVSASGSPTLATKVRDELKHHLDPRWIEMATVMQELRPAVLASTKLSAERSKLLFLELAGDTAMSVLADQGRDGLNAWLLERYPELAEPLSSLTKA